MQLTAHQYIPFLERFLTPKRLQHTLGVAQVMDELVDIYDLDREQAMTAGLLHDAAKDLTPAQQAEIIPQAQIEILTPCDRNYLFVLHGPVGAFLVQRELGINDPLVLDAICMHTFYGGGPTFDDPLCWCVRFADVLEPNRNWSKSRWLKTGAPRLKELVYTGRLDESAFLQTSILIPWFSAMGYPIHPNIRRIHQVLGKR
jgi:predicted HD superfamily hydrolase involved in NAD metabolism